MDQQAIDKKVEELQNSCYHNLDTENINDYFICHINLGFTIRPFTTVCCGQTFCKNCIQSWLNKNNECPLCRQELTLQQMVEEISKFHINYINSQVLQCPYCDWKNMYELLIPHLQTHIECLQCKDIFLNLNQQIDNIKKDFQNECYQIQEFCLELEQIKEQFDECNQENDHLQIFMDQLQDQLSIKSQEIEQLKQNLQDEDQLDNVTEQNNRIIEQLNQMLQEENLNAQRDQENQINQLEIQIDELDESLKQKDESQLLEQLDADISDDIEIKQLQNDLENIQKQINQSFQN